MTDDVTLAAARPDGPPQDELITFVRECRDAAERERLARVEAASTWRDGTDDDHEECRLMAERQSGRPISKLDSVERERIAAIQDRIAAKSANKVRLFDAILAAVSASRTAQVGPQDVSATLARLAIYCFNQHGDDAYLYNALADLAGPEAMRRPASRTDPAVPPHQELLERVQNYLGNGGLFNPESMEHDKVRELIIDLAAALPSSPAEGHEDK